MEIGLIQTLLAWEFGVWLSDGMESKVSVYTD
jgi:hypothetical protein